MSAEIKKLTLQIGKREIELSIEDAKALKEALEKLFGQNVIRIEQHHHDAPWRWWGPVYTNTPLTIPAPDMRPYEITCEGGSTIGASFKAETGTMILAVKDGTSL